MGDMADLLYEQELMYELTHGKGADQHYFTGDEMSEQKVKGIVKKYHTKSGTGKRGPWTKHSVLLDNDQWYNFGFDAPNPPVQEGFEVGIAYEVGQYGNDVKRHKVLSDKPTHAPGNGSSGGTGNVGMAWGNASNVAASVLESLVAMDALPITAASGKANKAKRFDEILEIFDKLRVKLYKDAEDINRVLDNVADFGDIQDEEPAPLPDQDESDEFFASPAEQEDDDDF